jgi:hypothetical protein
LWHLSKWYVGLAVVLLVGLPAVFSTRNDKRTVLVATPGPIRVALELFLYSVAAIAPWFAWPPWIAGIAVVVVVAAVVSGVPRALWLIRGAPKRYVL